MNNNIKKCLKRILKYLSIYLGMSALFFFLMICSYLLPNDNIRDNVEKSLPVLISEEKSPTYFGTAASSIDNFTDSLILNIAMNKGTTEEESNIKKAVENSYYMNDEEKEVYSLKNAIESNLNNIEYSRYWHGIQVIIRPLLMFFTYTEIRYILMFLIFSILAIVLGMIGKELNILHALAFGITISLMYIVMIPMSIQYSGIFLVTLFAMIAVLQVYKNKKDNNIAILFFIIGGFATFFDLLTYPLVTLGIPIVLALVLENKKEEKSLSQQLLFIIKLGIMWAVGYTSIFFAKWIIASIILHKDVITLSLDQLLFRVNGNNKYPVNRLLTLNLNFNYFFIPIAIFILVTIFTFWIILVLIYGKEFKKWKNIIPFLCIAIIPYLWYIIFAGHSSIHAWFTNKIQAVTIFAILNAMIETLDFSHNKVIIKKKD